MCVKCGEGSNLNASVLMLNSPGGVFDGRVVFREYYLLLQRKYRLQLKSTIGLGHQDGLRGSTRSSFLTPTVIDDNIKKNHFK